MTYSRDHKGCRCWACGRVIEEPIRGLCFDCYTALRQPGQIGHTLLDGPVSSPPFVTLALETEPKRTRSEAEA
jgi:hypothetical protein